MQFTVYNQQGQEVRKEDIATNGLEDVKINPDLVHQVVVASLANKRHAIAHTKQRGEVSGGGIKPWKQKHTGRARHGSIRSPLWVGGGIVFGPRSTRNFSKTIPKKMYRSAFAMALGDKIRSGACVLVESLALSQIKTKEMAAMLSRLPMWKEAARAHGLVVVEQSQIAACRAVRNIKKWEAVRDADVGIISLLKAKYLVATPASLQVLIGRCAKKKAV